MLARPSTARPWRYLCRPLAAALLLTLCFGTPLYAGTAGFWSRVSRLAGVHHDGQTFLTWTSPPGTGWLYRVYESEQPILKSEDLLRARLIATVGDSTWYDRRLSVIRGATQAYAIDSLAEPLDATQGLYVKTVESEGPRFYAVTVQIDGFGEQRAVVPGENALLEPVEEWVGLPKPIYQRTVLCSGVPVEIYTLWSTSRSAPLFPAMANREGETFDCGIVRAEPGPQSSLMILMHPRGGFFLQRAVGTGEAGEWLLLMDDEVKGPMNNTYWYGYHSEYQKSPALLPPDGGLIEDYTMRRLVHTVEWARRTFPVDPTRVYAWGNSMGAIGGVFLAFRRPDLLAGVFAMVPKFDFSFLDEPDPASMFNPGGAERTLTDHIWGTVSADLPTSDGIPVYKRMDADYLAGALEGISIPPILAFNGKLDNVVGWAEKIGFYQAMNAHRQGGYFFFDQRYHNSTNSYWVGMENPGYLYRFRTNRSFPALSNCSADQDPGNGLPESGDSVGVINALVEWDTTLIDEPTRWQTTLSLRELSMRDGIVTAPSVLAADVTPRRLQRFGVDPGVLYSYRVERALDGYVLQSGEVVGDSLGLVTIPGVVIEREGVRLTIQSPAPTGVGDAVRGPFIRLSRNPVIGPSVVGVLWPSDGWARVVLLDTPGRVEHLLWEGPVVAGRSEIRLDTAGLRSGVYFVLARQKERMASQRVVVLR